MTCHLRISAAATREGICYLTGGATAVLVGWRGTTIDVDVALEPEQDELLRELPRIKNELGINVELASPRDFIPVPGSCCPCTRDGGVVCWLEVDWHSAAVS